VSYNLTTFLTHQKMERSCTQFSLKTRIRDQNLLDMSVGSLVAKKDAIVEIEKIRAFARSLRGSTSSLGDFELLRNEIPMIRSSVNQIIAGEGRTLADLFDLTEWADNLSGTPTSFSTTDYILLSELLSQIRAALSNATKPNLVPGELPPVPDMEYFEVAVAGNCAGNNKALSVDVLDSSGVLNITICSFLELEVELDNIHAKVRKHADSTVKYLPSI
jgi:hypothetical protein